MVRCKVDGYDFGDRLLEGVHFTVEIDPETVKVVSVQPSSKDDEVYLDDLNKSKWLKRAEQYVQAYLDDGIETVPVTETELKNFLKDDCFIIL